MLQCQALPCCKFAQEIFLRPIEVRLLVHFRAALARGHGERANVDAIRFRALQQRDVAERRRDRLERAPSDCAASHRWFGSAPDRASRRPGSALHRARHRRDGLYLLAPSRLARIAPDRSGRSGHGGRHGARAACGAIALQRRSRRSRRSAAVRHFPPTRSRPRSLLSCRPLQNSSEEIAAFTSSRPHAASAAILAFRRVRQLERTDIQATLRNCDGTRTLDYRSPIRHPARRSIKPGIAYRKTKSLGFRAHIAQSPDQHRPSENQKDDTRSSSVGRAKQRGSAYETS